MSLKEKIISDSHFPKLPKDLADQIRARGEVVMSKQPWNIQESEEVRVSFTRDDGLQGYRFYYFDKDRNPNQVFPAHLIVGSKLHV